MKEYVSLSVKVLLEFPPFQILIAVDKLYKAEGSEEALIKLFVNLFGRTCLLCRNRCYMFVVVVMGIAKW